MYFVVQQILNRYSTDNCSTISNIEYELVEDLVNTLDNLEQFVQFIYLRPRYSRDRTLSPNVTKLLRLFQFRRIHWLREYTIEKSTFRAGNCTLRRSVFERADSVSQSTARAILCNRSWEFYTIGSFLIFLTAIFIAKRNEMILDINATKFANLFSFYIRYNFRILIFGKRKWFGKSLCAMCYLFRTGKNCVKIRTTRGRRLTATHVSGIF